MSPAEIIIELTERDGAGKITTTYVESAASEGRSRVDAVLPTVRDGYVQQLFDVFLPAGYPSSVTDDYIQYQIYDSLQAFSSSIAGLLASRAVLEGVGVGDASASPTAALLLSIVQESMGRIATILFAHRLGTALEPECKMYRLAADIFNDTAMVVDCLSPAFPKTARVVILSFSSVLRSLCGVCAGSSKASLSAHFAKRGNLGELNAKDSSQETVISLLGMLAGSIMVPWVSTPIATWSTLLVLLAVHLATNYAAVKSVCMHSLNRQRANIVLSQLLQDGRVLSPAEVSTKERIFERDGVLRWTDDTILGHCSIGVPLKRLLSQIGQHHQQSGALHLQAVTLSDLVKLYQNDAYLLWSCGHDAVIVLKECSPRDQLKAWTQALLLARKASTSRMSRGDGLNTSDGQLADLKSSLDEAQKLLNRYEAKMRDAGWDLELASLETRPGLRIQVETSNTT